MGGMRRLTLDEQFVVDGGQEGASGAELWFSRLGCFKTVVVVVVGDLVLGHDAGFVDLGPAGEILSLGWVDDC